MVKPGSTSVAVDPSSTELMAMNSAEETSSTAALVDGRVYKLYKRRFFGLAQLSLLNLIISWNWLTFAPIAGNAAQWFGVSLDAINWLSTGVLFAFVAISPVVLYTLHKGGPSQSIRVASGLALVGIWVRWKGTMMSSFGVTIFGQVLIGLAQPFVLSAPSRYANLWFSDRGRVTATAIASLANPLGGALGQLISPIWAPEVGDISNMVLWTAILSTVICLAGIVTWKQPPTPPSAIAAEEKYDLGQALRELPRNQTFWLIAVPFVVYVGFFNAFSSLLSQILEPYGFTDEDAGIAGALLIVVGLVAAAIASPVIDRTRAFLKIILILVPVIAGCYIILIFMPQTASLPGPYIVCSVLGAASFILLPCALEYMAQVTHPVSAEISSTISWTGSQLFGGIFILVMSALRAPDNASPPQNMFNALVFEACVACIAAPFPFFILWRRRRNVQLS